jgi:hypothetical protein
VTVMNPRQLAGALQACARGHYPLEAGTGLLADCGSWLHRDNFTSRFITAGTSISDGVTLLASIDCEAAVTALHAGELPASSGERRMLLLAASIASGTLVSLNDALPGASIAATRPSPCAPSRMQPGFQIRIKNQTKAN